LELKIKTQHYTVFIIFGDIVKSTGCVVPVPELLASGLVSRIVTTPMAFVCAISFVGMLSSLQLQNSYRPVLIYTTVRSGKKMQACSIHMVRL
jgi:hypothetical protein